MIIFTYQIKSKMTTKMEYPTLDQMQGFVSYCGARIKELQESETKRMENYYNCIDDYSFGGICSQANSQEQSRWSIAKTEMQLQIEEGKFVESFQRNILCTLDGELVSERTVIGKFGKCWIIGEGSEVEFVGLAKRSSTYAKKGYKVRTVTEIVKGYYVPKMTKKGLMTVSEIVSEIITDTKEEALQNVYTYKHKKVYFAKQLITA